MNIYIPDIDFNSIDKRNLFIVARPFFLGESWGNNADLKTKWGISDSYTNDIAKAHALLIPKPINSYSKQELKRLNTLCKKHQIKGYGFIDGDSGEEFKNYESLDYFRAGGFKSQLSKKNLAIPVTVIDRYESIYRDKSFDIRNKNEIPTLGFCGHASASIIRKWKNKLDFISQNILRFLQNPFRRDYEPLFASAYERFKLLMHLEKSSIVTTNFVYRKKYRAGASMNEIRIKTTREYFENIRQSDYILCVRGRGNFSVRLYETLMMGRIPVFLDTDCLLPFDSNINWNKHIVWVQWEKRHDIDKIIVDFHNKLSQEEFIELQHNNRLFWKNALTIKGIFDHIKMQAKVI